MRKTYTLKMGCLLGDQAAIYLMKLMTGEEVVAEYRFHPSRDWRFDFAIPSRRVAIEVESGAFNQWPPYPPRRLPVRPGRKVGIPKTVCWKLFWLVSK